MPLVLIPKPFSWSALFVTFPALSALALSSLDAAAAVVAGLASGYLLYLTWSWLCCVAFYAYPAQILEPYWSLFAGNLETKIVFMAHL